MTKRTVLLAIAIGTMLTTGTAALAARGDSALDWPNKSCIDGIPNVTHGGHVPC